MTFRSEESYYTRKMYASLPRLLKRAFCSLTTIIEASSWRTCEWCHLMKPSPCPNPSSPIPFNAWSLRIQTPHNSQPSSTFKKATQYCDVTVCNVSLASFCSNFMTSMSRWAPVSCAKKWQRVRQLSKGGHTSTRGSTYLPDWAGRSRTSRQSEQFGSRGLQHHMRAGYTITLKAIECFLWNVPS